jgi:hypothetical protein
VHKVQWEYLPKLFYIHPATTMPNFISLASGTELKS